MADRHHADCDCAVCTERVNRAADKVRALIGKAKRTGDLGRELQRRLRRLGLTQFPRA